jgi:hypothetical protein
MPDEKDDSYRLEEKIRQRLRDNKITTRSIAEIKSAFAIDDSSEETVRKHLQSLADAVNATFSIDGDKVVFKLRPTSRPKSMPTE